MRPKLEAQSTAWPQKLTLNAGIWALHRQSAFLCFAIISAAHHPKAAQTPSDRHFPAVFNTAEPALSKHRKPRKGFQQPVGKTGEPACQHQQADGPQQQTHPLFDTVHVATHPAHHPGQPGQERCHQKERNPQPQRIDRKQQRAARSAKREKLRSGGTWPPWVVVFTGQRVPLQNDQYFANGRF